MLNIYYVGLGSYCDVITCYIAVKYWEEQGVGEGYAIHNIIQ